MMNEQEFYKNIQERITGFLPEQYATAQITLTTRVKNNDVEQTGIMVQMPKETATPIIYLDAYFRQYEEGRGFEDILTEIAQVREQAMDGPVSMLDADFISDYENVRPRLQLRIFDTEKNEKRLSGIVHHSFGDYSAGYCVLLSGDQEHSMSALVTPSLMETWGITKKTLHEDTILADLNRAPLLAQMGDMVHMAFSGEEPKNFLCDPDITLEDMPDDMEPLFVLTNREKVNGAGLILIPEIQELIADLVGGGYYVLPSSIHEVLIMPDRLDRELMDARGLVEMVRTINETTVAPEDVLSDKVEYYDPEIRKLVNAVVYEREHDWNMVPAKAKVI